MIAGVLMLLLSGVPDDAPVLREQLSAPRLSFYGPPLGGGAVVGEGGFETAAVVVPVAGGEVVPADGCYMDTPSCISVARRIQNCEAKVQALEQGFPVWQMALAGLMGLAVGAGATWVALSFKPRS